MAKRTAIIDLGSNSMRMAIFERTSRWAFFTLGEYKSKVRLAQGGYEKDGRISEASMKKAVDSFGEFVQIAKSSNCRKIFAVGTSALRDAPNGKELIKEVNARYNINLKVINGKTEAIYGAVAATNLIAPYKNAITIDIGGGSTELALINEGNITKAISLDIGTVRLKELFYDNKNLDKLKFFLNKTIEKIPEDFKCKNIIAIGGSLRALSSAIISQSKYPLDVLHGFEYKFEQYYDFLEQIANSAVLDLNRFYIKKERFDTIREGAHIFLAVAKKICAKKIITSGVGVREGVFLSDFLRLSTDIKKSLTSTDIKIKANRFPNGLNPNLKSILDRYTQKEKSNITKYAKDIFMALKPLHNLDDAFSKHIITASKLCDIGAKIGFYSDHKNSAYIVLNSLNFGFTHEEKILIATIIGTNGKKNIYEYEKYKNLLPSENTIRWLSFMLYLAKALSINKSNLKLDFELDSQALKIKGAKELYLAKDEIKKLAKPDIFAITFS